jgi:hypothetical protein
MRLHVIFTEKNLLPLDFYRASLGDDPLFVEAVRVTQLEGVGALDYRRVMRLVGVRPGEIPVLVLPRFTDEEVATFGYAWDSYMLEPGRWTDMITLNASALRRSGPFTRIFSGWVLRHELGHLKGLRHHFNPFCVMMAKFNVSFGRFCARCKRLART